MPSQQFRGVLVPVLTPFSRNGEPDAGRFVAFCRWLLDQGAGGLAIFGTTSEANSMAATERMALLDRLIEAGIPAREADAGNRRLLDDRSRDARPPCGRSWLRRRLDAAAVLLQAGQRRRPLCLHLRGRSTRLPRRRSRSYLYHIPPVAVVGYSLDLVGRFIKAYPDTVVGLKDSSGDWNNTAACSIAIRALRSSPAPRSSCSTGCARVQPAALPPRATSTCRASRRSTTIGRPRRRMHCRPRSRRCARPCRRIRWCRR